MCGNEGGACGNPPTPKRQPWGQRGATAALSLPSDVPSNSPKRSPLGASIRKGKLWDVCGPLVQTALGGVDADCHNRCGAYRRVPGPIGPS